MYTKLASTILTSTVWMESDQTRIVWMTLLAMKDQNGEVQASIPGLANAARVPIEACEEALKVFLSPDPYSRTKTDEGRRIEEIDGGWAVINHEKYQYFASDHDRKSKSAERQKRYRERNKRNGVTVKRNAHESGVTRREKSRQIPHTDTDTDTNTNTDTKVKTEGEGGGDGKASTPPTLEEVRAECERKGYQGIDPSQWWAYWDSVAWCDRNGRPIRWRSRLMSDALSPKPSWRIEAEKLAKAAKAAGKSQYKPLTSD